MKICFYCDSIFSFGGVQRVLADIAKGLSVEHEVTILTSDDPALEDRTMYGLGEVHINFRYIRYPRSPFYEYYLCKAYSLLYKKVLPQNRLMTKWYTRSSFSGTKRAVLARELNRGRYDVVIGVHVYPSFYLATVRKQVKARMVGWLHTSFDAFFSHPGMWLWGGEERFKYQMELLDKVVVLTRNDQQLYSSRMELETEVIYNPLTQLPAGKCNPENKKFLAIGRMSHLTKGFDILVEAFALFARYDNEWTLDIVGEGPEEANIRLLVTKYRLEGRITIHPFTRDIYKYYTSASVFVLSSRWEGFSLVMVEAMSYGLPLIISNIPAAMELVGKASNALIFVNEDAVDLSWRMMDMSERHDLERMGEVSRQLTEKMRLTEILSEWEKVFNI